MNWMVRVRLLDARGVPCEDADVDVCRYTTAGQPAVAAQGRTDANGVLALKVQGEVRTYLQRVSVRAKTSDGSTLVAENPVSHTAKVVDFGTLVVVAGGAAGAGGPGGGPVGAGAGAHASTGQALAASESALEQLAAERVQLRNELAAAVAARESAVEHARREATAEAARQVEAKVAEIGRLREELARANAQLADQGATTLQELALGVGQQLETAAVRLGEGASPLRLSNASLQIKGVSTGTGHALRFLKPEEIGKVGGRNLSTVELEYRVGPGAVARNATPLPDVLGSSGQRAIRLLEESGWPCAVREQWVEVPANGPSPDGRVLRQHPAAGTPLAPGETVTLTLGRAAPGEPS